MFLVGLNNSAAIDAGEVTYVDAAIITMPATTLNLSAPLVELSLEARLANLEPLLGWLRNVSDVATDGETFYKELTVDISTFGEVLGVT